MVQTASDTTWLSNFKSQQWLYQSYLVPPESLVDPGQTPSQRDKDEHNALPAGAKGPSQKWARGTLILTDSSEGNSISGVMEFAPQPDPMNPGSSFVPKLNASITFTPRSTRLASNV